MEGRTRKDRGVGRVAGILAAGFLALPAALAGQGADRFVGDWEGTLQAGPQALPIIFHITAGDEGLAATMDSPAQGAYGIAVGSVVVSGDSITLGLPAIQGQYAGELQADGTITGTWSQGPASLPLNLAPVEPGAEASPAAPAIPDAASRPQTPKPPFPYDAQEVEVPSLDGSFTLAGTLTTPREGGPFPGVVLVSGSGPQDRDETLMGHKPFAVLADHLTRAGIAVLRYDDRGVAGSGGDFQSATSVELADDAQAVAAWLKARPEVGPVGIVGHSEGGLVAPMVAARDGHPLDFVVLLAGPGMPGDEIILDQSRRIARAEGIDAEMVEENLAVNRELFQVVRETRDPEERSARIRAILEETVAGMTAEERAAQGLTEASTEAWIQQQVRQLSSPWMGYFLTYDPVPALEATRVPVLALNGSLDLQVPAEANLAAIRAALERGGNPDFTVEALPGLNHLFQSTETGAPSEYARIEETMDPVVLERVAEWILTRFGGR